MKNLKAKKKSLKSDTVNSTSFHIGIELELTLPLESGCGEHDDEACAESHKECMRSDGSVDVLQNYFDLSRDEARRLDSYFDFDSWLDDYMDNWSCDDSECPYNASESEDGAREALCDQLTDLTGNSSFKVVEDGSIRHGSNETDAEVCWNYFGSKETQSDNAKILKHLKSNGLEFNESCGLHINLNNYLKLDVTDEINTSELDFLFNFVGKSRRNNSYCNRFAISSDTKYSMLYEQGDRVEFRFFSPTLDAEKLNMYVSLANTVYNRLCGRDKKLPRKTELYFIEKLQKINGLSLDETLDSLNKVNNLKSYKELNKKESDSDIEMLESLVESEAV